MAGQRLFQALLVSLVFIQTPSIKLVGAFLLLLVPLRSYLLHFKAEFMESSEYRVLKSINTLHLCMATVVMTL